MKKLFILALLFASLASSAQYLPDKTYGKDMERLNVKLALAVPSDTLPPPPSKDTLPHIAAKNDILWLWSPSAQKFYRVGTDSSGVTPVSWSDIIGSISGNAQLVDSLDGKEPIITPGLVTQYWSGIKTWRNLYTDVRAIGDTAYVRDTDTAWLNTYTRALNGGADALTFTGGLGRDGNEVYAQYYNPYWNANRIQGMFVDATRPGHHNFLGMDSVFGVLRWMPFDSIAGVDFQKIIDSTTWDATRYWVQQQAYLTSFTETDPVFNTNGVKLTGNQTVAGFKTFTNDVVAPIYEWKGSHSSSIGRLTERTAGADKFSAIEFLNSLNANNVIFSTVTPTASRSINLPDATGTVALQEWVTAQGYSTSTYNAENAQDDVGGILVDGNTVNLTYNDAAPSITAEAITQMSITSDASGLKLVGDAASPGNSKYYGTDGSGVRGFYDNLTATNWGGYFASVNTQSLTSLTVSNTYQMYAFNGTSAANWTMPARVGGKVFWFKNAGTANLTLTRAGSDEFYTTTNVTSITLTPGLGVQLVSAANYWYVFPYEDGAGSGSGSFIPLFTNGTNTTNSTTAQEDIYTYTISAGTLAADGDKIVVDFRYSLIGGGTSNTVNLVVGDAATTNFVSTSASGTGDATITIIRLTSTTAKVIVGGMFNFGPLVQASSLNPSSLNFTSNSLDIKFRCTANAVGSVTLQTKEVTKIKAP